MIIKLSKEIPLYSFEFIGEVEFFDKGSPYMELLKGIKNEAELSETFENNDMSEAAIKNIIKVLENLKVLKNGEILNIEDGFPNKEYGKYHIEVFENDSKLPFKNKNKSINRIKAETVDNAEVLDKNNIFFKKIRGKSTNFIDNKNFEIKAIENDRFLPLDAQNKTLTIGYQNNKWFYSLDKKIFNLDKLSFCEIFRGEWDEEYKALNISFPLVKKREESIYSMEYDYPDTLDLKEYGKVKGEFQSIPVLPKTFDDAKDWFLYLLKDEIEKKNSYISKNELEQMWNNLMDIKPKFKKFELELKFDFEMILKEFGKDSKYYWLLKAGVDLYPFDNTIAPKDQVFIENIDDFSTNFNFEIKDLVIIDNYINTTRHLKILEDVLIKTNTPNIKKYTTETFKHEKTPKEMDKIISKYNITKVTKDKKELPHDRYWLFNKEHIYKTGGSLDGIASTSFDKYDLSDIKKIDNKAYEILKDEVDG